MKRSLAPLELTYEGWKQFEVPLELADNPEALELTYEGWKQISVFPLSSIPPSLELTYEGWKLLFWKRDSKDFCSFGAYLRGMET